MTNVLICRSRLQRKTGRLNVVRLGSNRTLDVVRLGSNGGLDVIRRDVLGHLNHELMLISVH